MRKASESFSQKEAGSPARPANRLSYLGPFVRASVPTQPNIIPMSYRRVTSSLEECY